MVLNLARLLFALLLCLHIATNARADAPTLRPSLERFEETVRMRIEDNVFTLSEVSPLIVVSLTPYYEESRASFAELALASLQRTFPSSGIRVCTPCMIPQTEQTSKGLQLRIGAPALEEIRQNDARYRKDSPEAKAGIWLDETSDGISVRIVDLQTARVIYADNITPELIWTQRSSRNFDRSRDLSLRLRGESITHTMFDLGIFPTPHFSVDFLEQWGNANQHLSGLSVAVVSPFLGLGAVYARAFPEFYNVLVGGKIYVGVLTMLAQNLLQSDIDVFGSLYTLEGFVKWPVNWLGRNAVFVYVNSNFDIGVGVSFLQL